MTHLPSFVELMASLGLQDSPVISTPSTATDSSLSTPATSPAIVVSPVHDRSYGRRAGHRYAPYFTDDPYPRRGSLPGITKATHDPTLLVHRPPKSYHHRASSLSPRLRTQPSLPSMSDADADADTPCAPISALLRHPHHPTSSSSPPLRAPRTPKSASATMTTAGSTTSILSSSNGTERSGKVVSSLALAGTHTLPDSSSFREQRRRRRHSPSSTSSISLLTTTPGVQRTSPPPPLTIPKLPSLPTGLGLGVGFGDKTGVGLLSPATPSPASSTTSPPHHPHHHHNTPSGRAPYQHHRSRSSAGSLSAALAAAAAAAAAASSGSGNGATETAAIPRISSIPRIAAAYRHHHPYERSMRRAPSCEMMSLVDRT